MLFIFRNEFNGDYNFRMVLETQVIFLPSSDVLDKQFEVQLFSPNIFSQLDNNWKQKHSHKLFCSFLQPKKVANPDWIVSIDILRLSQS